MPGIESGSRSYKLTMDVFLHVCSTLRQKRDFSGERIIGFELPDGRILRPVFCIEEQTGEGNYRDISGSDELKRLGLMSIDYGNHTFEEQNIEEAP